MIPFVSLDALFNQETLKIPSHILQLVKQLSLKYEVPFELILSLVKVESNFNPQALSPKGAMGLMQIMPSTANFLGIQNPFDPRENLEAGVRYFKTLLERFGDLSLALAAYNAGPKAVMDYQGIPPFPETRSFVNKVFGWFEKFSSLFSNERLSEVKAEEKTVTLLPSPSQPDRANSQSEWINPKEADSGEGFYNLKRLHQNIPNSLSKAPGREALSIILSKVQEVSEGFRDVSKKPEALMSSEGSSNFDLPMFLLSLREQFQNVSSSSRVQEVLKSFAFQETEPIKGLVDEIVKWMRIEEGPVSQKVQIQLKPEVLGGLRVELEGMKEELKLEIKVSNKEVRNLIEANLGEIQKALNAQGLRLVSIQVHLDQSFQEGNKDRGGRTKGEGDSKKKGKGELEEFKLTV
jgi:flagellar hook-length control protein FliK